MSSLRHKEQLMRQLIIRGDLQSHSGYSTAARDYCRVLAGFFDRLVGVDIHHSAERPFEPFPYPLVSEAEARRLAGEADFALVLSFTTPDYYARYHGAVNVGLTFWGNRPAAARLCRAAGLGEFRQRDGCIVGAERAHPGGFREGRRGNSHPRRAVAHLCAGRDPRRIAGRIAL